MEELLVRGMNLVCTIRSGSRLRREDISRSGENEAVIRYPNPAKVNENFRRRVY